MLFLAGGVVGPTAIPALSLWDLIVLAVARLLCILGELPAMVAKRIAEGIRPASKQSCSVVWSRPVAVCRRTRFDR